MKHKLLAVLSILVLVGMLPGAAFAAPKPIDYSPMDAGPRIREMPATPDMIASNPDLPAEQLAAQAAVDASATDCVTVSKIFLILNDFEGRYQATFFNLMGESSGTQVWVQANLAWPSTQTTRVTPVVTCDQVQYLIGQFDSNIYPKETSYFGMPDPLDGSYAVLPSLLGLPSDYYFDEAGRQIVLVSNVRDDNYYDPTYPNYIAGFYSPTFELYFDRNIMSIDAFDWANRVGPDTSPWRGPDASKWRPYLYEGIFAHEYQHLLHDDYDSDEESWINEGMADYAMVLTGYGDSVIGHLNDTANLPENSLVLWEDQGGREVLADYGNAFLFQYYLMEKFGDPFIQALFHNQLNSISGVNDALANYGVNKTFADLYHDWAVAKLIDSKTPAGGAYQFKGLDFNLNIGTPDAPNPQAYDTPGAGPWGTDYLWVSGDPKKLGKLTFNGLDYSIFPSAWTVDNGMLWSGTGDLLDNWAIFETTGGGTLTFDTIWDLEDYWDFGFVQVSTDGGYTWTSLANAYTTSDYDPNAHPTVIANLPGLTACSGAVVNNVCQLTKLTMNFDLGAYAGQNILVAFRMVTDWGTHYGGWWIDNVYVDSTLISDGTNAAVFKDITDYLPVNNDFTVTFVGFKGKGKGTQYKVLTMKLDNVTEDGMFELNKILKWSDKAAMLVTYDAAEGTDFYADYTYDFTFTNQGPKK